MTLDQIANFIRGNLSDDVDSTQTSFPVDDASIFPDVSSSEYNLVVWDVNSFARPDQDSDVEIVRVTSRDTTTDELTVTRGQEETSGSTHPSGSALQLAPTQKVFDDIESEFNNVDSQLESKADDPHGNAQHSETFATADDNVEGFATAGEEGTVPTSQGDGTLAMESAAAGAIALEEYATSEDVPPASEVTQPTIAYVADVGDGTDDYIGVFES